MPVSTQNGQASWGRAEFQILLADGARSCWKIGRERRQLALVINEKGEIVDHG